MPGFRQHWALLALGLVVLTGCGRAGGSFGAHSRTSSWTHAGKDGVPGIDSASVAAITLTVDGNPTPFLIWSDLDGGGSGRGSSNQTSARYVAKQVAQDGRQIDILVEVTETTPPTLKINEQVYDFKGGNFFLVRGSVEPLEVRQLQIDPRMIPIESESLIKLAKSTPEIREFFDRKMP